MTHKKKILFIYKNPSSFIKKDEEILRAAYNVNSFSFNPSKKILTPFVFIYQLFFLLFYIKNTNIIVCEFAGYHTLLPLVFGRIFKIRSAIILCGTECHSFPSINYGNHNKKLMSWFTCKSLRLAHHLIPVHRSLVLCNYTYHNDDFPQQGYKYHCKNVNTPFTEINYGYDSAAFFNNQKRPGVIGNGKIKNSFLTVALNVKGSTFYRKGIDLIIEVAFQCPEFTFTIIGAGNDLQHLNLPPNLTVLPPLPYDSLIEYYSKYEFYFQLSIAEGFPNALCEAMLCECIPIGSDVYAIPDIIGDSGFILKRKNNELLKTIVETAVSSDKAELSKKARQRIIENFPLKKREYELINTIESIN